MTCVSLFPQFLHVLTSRKLYSQKTWHTASSPGASATIKFNGYFAPFPVPFRTLLNCALGTGIWVFGAKKPGYGTYNISVDGQSVSGNAQSQDATFQQLLGGRSGLKNGPHIAVFTNTGWDSALDLDSIIFETQIGSAGSAFPRILLSVTEADHPLARQ